MIVLQNSFRPFSDYDLGESHRRFIEDLKTEIESDRKILITDEEEYVQTCKNKALTQPLFLDVENITVAQQEAQIPARYFPSGFFVDAGSTYPKPVMVFHLPFTGDSRLLRFAASSRLLGGG